jgi:hypothetical protein
MGRRSEEDMNEKPFLERWSGRKAVARHEADKTSADKPPLPEDAPVQAPAPATRSEVAPITEEELAALPQIETLTKGSDIRAFLRPGVPAALKNAALRKMWLATPAIRDHKDIAVDYAWDWNTPGGVPGDGGRLDPVKVKQWARQIAGLEEAAPKKAGAVPEESMHALPTEAPAATTAVKSTQIAKAARADEEARADEPAAPQRPRHGGARPQ